MRHIIVEGTDGTGKTSFCANLKKNYEGRGFSVEIVKFPTNPHIKFKPEVTPQARAFWYLGDFNQGLQSYKNRDDLDILILDRSYITTSIYQGFQDDEIHQELWNLIMMQGAALFAQGFPDLNVEMVFLSCSVKEAMRRIRGRNAEVKDELERMSHQDQFKMLNRLTQRYDYVRLALKHKAVPTILNEENPYNKARIISIDTTRLHLEEVVTMYTRKSLEPEYFEM